MTQADDQSMMTLISELGAMRQRLDRAFVGLLEQAQARPGDRAWEKQADTKFELLAKRYVEAIHRLATMRRSELVTTSASLMERLERGWLMVPSVTVSQETIDQSFSTLLARYEATLDALGDPHDVGRQHEQKMDTVHSARRYAQRSVA